MLRRASFYAPSGELQSAALLIRNLGAVAAEADGAPKAGEHAARWLAAVDAGAPERAAAWVPPGPPDPATVEDEAESEEDFSEEDSDEEDSDEDSEEDESGSESDASESSKASSKSSSSSSSKSGKSSESSSSSKKEQDAEEQAAAAAAGADSGSFSPDDPLARIHLRDAERTFAHPANRARLIRLLQVLAVEMDREYHQALAAIVGFLMLSIDSDADVLRAARHLLSPYYGLRPALRAESVLMAADGYVAHSLLPARFPGVAQQLDRHGVLPETYYQRLRIAAGVGMLPFRALFPAIDGLFAHGERWLFALTLAGFAHLRGRIEAARTASEVFTVLHLDPEVWGADKDEKKREGYLEMCAAMVANARALCDGTEGELEGLPAEDAAALRAAWSDLLALDLDAERARLYDAKLKARLERKWRDQILDARRAAREEEKKRARKEAKKEAKKAAKKAAEGGKKDGDGDDGADELGDKMAGLKNTRQGFAAEELGIRASARSFCAQVCGGLGSNGRTAILAEQPTRTRRQRTKARTMPGASPAHSAFVVPDGSPAQAGGRTLLSMLFADRAPPPPLPSSDPSGSQNSMMIDPSACGDDPTLSLASTAVSSTSTVSLSTPQRTAFGPLGEYGMRSLPRGAKAPMVRRPPAEGPGPTRRRRGAGVGFAVAVAGGGPFPDLKTYWTAEGGDSRDGRAMGQMADRATGGQRKDGRPAWEAVAKVYL
ncbi:hypothetical protein DFJ74DRAFT_758592 [Hyaloraphidium curvatum]|nr:hypothetical protein DFJ74DRAFT_758592 [Hyaloraphidium curvatum]